MQFDDDDWDDEDEDEESEEAARLTLLARFAKGAAGAPFLSRLGEPITAPEADLAQTFCAALGFPDAVVVPVESFEAAAEAGETLGYDTAAWEATEQLRIGLVARANELLGEETVQGALQDVIAYLAVAVQDAVVEAGAVFDVADEPLLNAAAGATLRACHNAALVLLAGEDETHPLALEYRLFELGRWPVALTGSTLHLF
jgi:hypothetical protein